MAESPRRSRPLEAEPRSGGTDVLERAEPLPEADEGSLPDAGRATRHLPPDAARLAFHRPDDHHTGPRTLSQRLRAARANRSLPVKQLAMAAVVCVIGVALLAGWAVHVSWTPVVDIALVVLGIVLVLQSRRGAASRPLIALGVVLAVVAVATWRAEVTLDGGLGRRTVTPVRATTVDEQLGVGQLTIDLGRLAAGTRPVRVHAEVGVGRIVVEVPKGTTVSTHGVAGAGITFPVSERHVGVGIDELDTVAKVGERVVQLDLHVGIGTVEVRRG